MAYPENKWTLNVSFAIPAGESSIALSRLYEFLAKFRYDFITMDVEYSIPREPEGEGNE